jgi:leucyl aminopeptidase
MPPEIAGSREPIESVAVDALVVGATKREDGSIDLGEAAAIDEALDGRLSEYLQQSGFKGKLGDVSIVPTLGRIPAETVAVAGLVDDNLPETTRLRRAAGNIARRLGEHTTAASVLHAGGSNDALEAAMEGFLLGSYRFTEYKSDPKPSKLERVLFLGGIEEDSVERARARASATILARDLTNEPASVLTPRELADRSKQVADSTGLECTVLEERELAERGFGGLIEVGKGSDQPPCLIQLRYVPANASGKVTLVGKGVTFDSGGLSLKTSQGMETMKTDMAGGAAAIGAMSALSGVGAGVEVMAFIPSVENMPGGNAIRPGDVIRHYGNKTSEVLNTDAEGRLVLADALGLASEQDPDAIVDAATLTGSMMVALGKTTTGFFATDDRIAQEIEEAAEAAGERIWRMPLYDDFRPGLDSEVADIKNTGSRWGGSIYGAIFLREFVGKDIPWAHLDIAGPARAESDHDEVIKGGSGVAARTMLAWVERRGS